ncbi:MAG: tRNA pseudouridine(38-40) synthase TruA [Candidatus Omnitrophica bacterium]|nr:tRNA pseudouridine(38-40) synthase TruA [Candidatus Omnitrophota bacterium]
MLRNIKLTLEYDGTDFYGWQVQIKSRRTVQAEIEKALKKIFKKHTTLFGSGRTDSGVHALGQVANFHAETKLPITTIQTALNANFPKDIAVVGIEEVGPRFHARFSVKSKTYRYAILNRPARCAIERRFCLFYPYPLNLRSMRAEARALAGRHDFRSFQAANPSRDEKATTVRTVHRIEIKKKDDFIYIDIEADGFLYKMVRNIVGALLQIGRGKLSKGGMRQILKRKDRSVAPAPAKAQGLTLVEVKY